MPLWSDLPTSPNLTKSNYFLAIVFGRRCYLERTVRGYAAKITRLELILGPKPNLSNSLVNFTTFLPFIYYILPSSPLVLGQQGRKHRLISFGNANQ